MPSATVIGSTGLVGSNILNTLLASRTWTPITTISRRAPTPSPSLAADASAKLTATVATDVDEWPELVPASTEVLFSALGTTRAAAGSIAAQTRIDQDANVALIQAAKAKGAKAVVFISSAGTGALSPFAPIMPYVRMKVGVERAIRDAAFDHAVVLRPGLILGDRGGNFKGAGDAAGQTLIKSVGMLGRGVVDALGQHAEVIARAAVRAAEMALRGEAPSKVWILAAADIIKLGGLQDDANTTGGSPSAGVAGDTNTSQAAAHAASGP